MIAENRVNNLEIAGARANTSRVQIAWQWLIHEERNLVFHRIITGQLFENTKTILQLDFPTGNFKKATTDGRTKPILYYTAKI